MIGDRMDTDVKSGLEAGLQTILVRTGISDDAEIQRYPYRPNQVIDSVAELADRVKAGVPIWKEQRHADGFSNWVWLE